MFKVYVSSVSGLTVERWPNLPDWLIDLQAICEIGSEPHWSLPWAVTIKEAQFGKLVGLLIAKLGTK